MSPRPAALVRGELRVHLRRAVGQWQGRGRSEACAGRPPAHSSQLTAHSTFRSWSPEPGRGARAACDRSLSGFQQLVCRPLPASQGQTRPPVSSDPTACAACRTPTTTLSLKPYRLVHPSIHTHPTTLKLRFVVVQTLIPSHHEHNTALAFPPHALRQRTRPRTHLLQCGEHDARVLRHHLLRQRAALRWRAAGGAYRQECRMGRTGRVPVVSSGNPNRRTGWQPAAGSSEGGGRSAAPVGRQLPDRVRRPDKHVRVRCAGTLPHTRTRL